MSKISLRAGLLLGCSLLASTPVLAQSPASSPQPDQPVAEAEDSIVVVGSRIEGSKIAETLPVSVLSEDRIAATGSVSGDDLFRSIPQAGDVQFQEARTTGNLNDARGDNASINLRNVGTGNTLVLVNGRRMILSPGTQTENFVPVQTANTNSLPVGATRRVEVLRDGAAAIYGADAVAGVINVVTNDKYQGLRFDARYGFADGMSESTGAVRAGIKTKSGGHFTFFGSYTHRTPLFASERPFSASENHMPALVGTPWEGDTSFDNRSTSSPWGSFTTVPVTAVRQGTVALTATGVFHIEPTANTAAGCSSTVISGNLCLRSGTITGANDRVLRYDENPDRTIRGGLDRINLFSTFRQEIGSVELFGEAGYYHAELDGQREQSAPISSAVITIPASNFYNPFGPTTLNGVANPNRLAGLTAVPAAGLPLRITTYRPVDTGPRQFTVTDDSFRTLLGVRGEWGNFKWDSAATYSWARTDDHTRNAISNTLFQAALARTTADAYNPFNGGSQPTFSLGDGTANSAATIDSFLVDVHRISKTSLGTVDFRISNSEIFSLPAGRVGFASGVEYRRETYEDNRDDRLDGTTTYTDSVTGIRYGTDIMGASPAPDVKAHRSVFSAYAELAVPLISEDMNIPLVQSLDLQLAARDEHYSDFGNVLKSKIAGAWTVMDGIKFRSAWSQSFRAPNLAQFYSAGTQVSNTRTDFAACRINPATACSGVSTLEVRSGNQSLEPENAETFSAGVIMQPRRNLTLTLDFWSLRSKGVIGLQGAQNQILFDLLERLGGRSNPNVVRLAPVGTQVIGTIDYVQDNYFNLGPRVLKGLDFAVSYDVKNTPLGNFNIDLSASKLLKFEQSASELQAQLIAANAAGTLGSGVTISQAGSQIQVNGNPEWRLSGNLTWKSGPVSAGVLVNYVGSVFDTGTAQVNGQFYKLPSFTTVNSYLQYRAGDDQGAFSGTRFRVGARNLFDKQPPLASTNYGFLGSLHDAVGRFVYFELSKEF
ncbi:MAG: TonB-dependent receptor [Sphingomonadales bacterium]|jgi:iron complex outermembrane receptor protein|uniref:TonB-dependent receptor domain-containing protein n=1 Tax=Sphingorhabdus sp. TaxID=1902408 RepID=UPI003BB1F079|nr:TonB-dependent receptor [Sphingomonadales bacterium]MBK9431360.1 TonB-dependent receptor [Sphingomonadales bacterium]MBL0022738.1 TonB-dependent receptor [Sphingomonadales bacterium]